DWAALSSAPERMGRAGSPTGGAFPLREEGSTWGGRLLLASLAATSRLPAACSAAAIPYPPFAPCQKGGLLDVPSPPALYSPRWPAPACCQHLAPCTSREREGIMFRRARTTDHPITDPTIIDAPVRGGLTPVSEWPEAAVPRMPAPGLVSSHFSGVCRYYHDCFAADSRGGVLTNLLDKNQAEYVTFAEVSDVLLTGLAGQLEMPLSTAVTAQNAADVNRREKFLIYGSIFLVGRGPSTHPRKRGELYCAPLLYWPARIEHEGSQAWMSVDLEEQRINFPLLASLIDAENDEQAQAYAEAILAQVPTAPFDVEAIREFSAVVGELIPELRTDDLYAWPELQTKDALSDLIEHDSPVQLLCASAMALIRRPTEARGVLTELQEMANSGVMSIPLAAIFGDAAK